MIFYVHQIEKGFSFDVCISTVVEKLLCITYLT